MSEDTFHLGIKGLIRNARGEILLMQIDPEHMKHHGGGAGEQQSYWDLPGGRVEKGSTVQETLKREITEETGVTNITNIKPVGMVLSNIRIPMGDDSYGLILSVYSCAIPGDAVIALSDEHTASEWVAPAEAAARLSIKYPPEFCQLVAAL